MAVLFDCVTSYICHSHRVRPEGVLKLAITACFPAAARHLAACQMPSCVCQEWNDHYVHDMRMSCSKSHGMHVGSCALSGEPSRSACIPSGLISLMVFGNLLQLVLHAGMW